MGGCLFSHSIREWKKPSAKFVLNLVPSSIKINSSTTKIDNDKPVLKLVVESAEKSQSKLQEQRIRNFTTHTNWGKQRRSSTQLTKRL